MKYLLLILFLPCALHAQEKPNSENYKTILRLDSMVFEEGFNKCNYKALEETVDTSLVFLHDVSGKMETR